METRFDDNWPDGLDDYEPIEKLAAGRLSTVVRATDTTTGRQVAVKVLHDHLADEPAVRRRLRREFAAVRRLDHPAIVRADDLIEDDDVVALVMEYIAGESVRQRVERDGAMGWDEAQPVVDDVLAGLEHAHHRGIWHRDLNAEHVLIDEAGRGRVVGFGMARVDELAALTMHTRVLGALEAMAPERILGLDYDGRADLYSAGAVTYEMLMGHAPNDGTMRAALSAARDTEIEELPENLPDEAHYLLERALVADPSVRFATAAQMRRAIDGMYDERMWQDWTSRHTESCPDCGAAVIDAIDTCLECGYEFNRLILNPGGGDWKVRILSRADTFVPDMPFEANMEPRTLTENEFQSLMEMLAAHDDTRPLAHGGRDFRYPPYILADQLTAEDARRISDRLDDAGIQHEIFDDRDGQFLDTGSGGGLISDTPDSFIFVFSYVAMATVGMLVAAHTMAELPDELLMGGVVVFALGIGLGRFGSRWWSNRRENVEETVTTTGTQGAMIPNDQLTAVGRLSMRRLVPDELAEVLRDAKDQAVRQELFELTVLASDVAEQLGRDHHERVRILLEELAVVSRQLATAKRRAAREPTPQLMQQLESVNRRLDDEPGDDAEALEQRRDELLQQLDERDAESAQIAAAQARMLTVRATLLDLGGDVWEAQAQHEVVLEFGDGPAEVVEELATVLEAQDEVEALG